MELQSQTLIGHFVCNHQQFYLDRLTNRQMGKTYLLSESEPFVIHWQEGGQLAASQMQVQLEKATAEAIQLDYQDDLARVKVIYELIDGYLKCKVSLLEAKQAINFLDLAAMTFQEDAKFYQPKEQEAIPEMAGFSGYYVACGQPIYANSFFLGMEFPLAENHLEEGRYWSRYYLGREVRSDQPVNLHATVIGSAATPEYSSIQQAFFAYIDSIALPNHFRLQYNSWYDHMLDIDEDKIMTSFAAIRAGFSDYGVPLDTYVVDDGWANYESFWEFNEKFPLGLSRIKDQVAGYGGQLGLWIGPRGGYGGTQLTMSNWLKAHPELGLGTKNERTQDVNVGDPAYLDALEAKLLAYQDQYDLSYWKLDGFLIEPAQDDASGPHGMHQMTATYERLISLFQNLRTAYRQKHAQDHDAKGAKRDLWLNLTSYVNPSPWWLAYVNSLWIQVSQDTGYDSLGETDLARMMTYRDDRYHAFISERAIQVPQKYFYNHEPIFAHRATAGLLDHPIQASVSEFRDYLYFIGTRGNAFWECYYSYDLFYHERWRANAEAIRWVQDNYDDCLKNSRFIGHKPADHTGLYGYRCLSDDGRRVILSLRNPTSQPQTYVLGDGELQTLMQVAGRAVLERTEKRIWQATLAPQELVIYQLTYADPMIGSRT